MATHHITFYSKTNCPLCDEVRDALEDLEAEFSLHIEEVDITTNLALYERYKHSIPVLVIDGKTTLSAPITEEDIRDALSSRESR